jgi:hypothetical protein
MPLLRIGRPQTRDELFGAKRVATHYGIENASGNPFAPKKWRDVRIGFKFVFDSFTYAAHEDRDLRGTSIFYVIAVTSFRYLHASIPRDTIGCNAGQPNIFHVAST